MHSKKRKMRYLLSVLIVVLITIVGCSSETERMNVSGKVRGLKKGTLLLQKFEDTLLVTIDSIEIDGNSNFSFSDKVESPEIYYLYLLLKDGTLNDDRITFFGENKNIEIQTNLKNFGSAARVSGSKNDSILKLYDKLKQRYVARNLELIEKRLKLRPSDSDSKLEEIEKQQQAVLSNKYLATINFAVNNSDYEVAPYLVLSEAHDANIKYLDTVYNALNPKIKDSKYGKELATYIEDRNKLDTTSVAN